MVTRMSQLFLRTLREDPADAEVPSHRLLVRAGYIRRTAPGIYTWLPLGKRILDTVAQIVREEMDRIGAQEVLFPALIPRDFYEASGRWTEYGDNVFRVVDRKGADYMLGPTHEEVFTTLVKGEYASYRDYPVTLYQIQTKYRDEARPRAGLLRGREFVMKDSYSFDVDDAGLDRSYAKHRQAYVNTFDRLGLDYVIVSAVSGALGGSRSEEFLQPTEIGEDTLVDLANERFPRADGRPWTAADTLKNVVVTLVHPDGSREPLVVGVPGDREVDTKRLEAAVAPAEVEPFTEFEKYPQLVKGYIGPEVLGEKSASGIRYLLDPRIVPGTTWITGANEPGRHVFDLVAGRDFEGDGTVEAA